MYYDDDDDLTHEDCLEHGNGPCSGTTEYRESLTGTGTRIPRCDRHWDARLRREDDYRTEFPDSPIAPHWFDPAAAGESWDY
jgi:hypothetical protein